MLKIKFKNKFSSNVKVINKNYDILFYFYLSLQKISWNYISNIWSVCVARHHKGTVLQLNKNLLISGLELIDDNSGFF